MIPLVHRPPLVTSIMVVAAVSRLVSASQSFLVLAVISSLLSLCVSLSISVVVVAIVVVVVVVASKLSFCSDLSPHSGTWTSAFFPLSRKVAHKREKGSLLGLITDQSRQSVVSMLLVPANLTTTTTQKKTRQKQRRQKAKPRGQEKQRPKELGCSLSLSLSRQFPPVLVASVLSPPPPKKTDKYFFPGFLADGGNPY